MRHSNRDSGSWLTLQKLHGKSFWLKYIKNESHIFCSGNKEQGVMFPVVFQSSVHFGFPCFCFCVPDRTWNLNQTPVKSSLMKLHLSVPINLLSFPWKKIRIQENFFVNFHLISLPQKLYHNFSSTYLFLEKSCTIYDTHISFWNRSFTKCRSMNCKLDKVSKNI